MSEKNIIHTFTEGHGRLKALAQRFLPHAADADDVLQDAFLRLWHRAEGIETQEYADRIAARTVANISIDRLRAQKKSVPLTECLTLAADAPPSHDKVYDILEGIIDTQLSEVQRKIVRMRDYECMDYEDIATAMDMQPAAVRMQISRARKRIRDVMRSNHEE